jgi:sterol desaturase/sphingolipid hydroxylase (fatty acid hydroxylase superfamily)
VHHSVRRQEVNSNYSVIFRVWDRLHRTLVLNVPQAEITIGVVGRRLAEDNAIGRLLVAPFKRKVQGPGAGADADDQRPARATDSRVRMAE